jgi:hypothetical protein
MTVAELFQLANLPPNGPVKFSGTDPLSPITDAAGVYVVARAGNANEGCKARELPLKDHPGIDLYDPYERMRWLPGEPIVYIGKTGRSVRKRVAEFRRQECGRPGPHDGGQIVRLLECDLWVYWSPANDLSDAEFTMLCAFIRHTGLPPFGNELGGRIRHRI